MEAEREAIHEQHRVHLASAGNRLLAAGAVLVDNGEAIVGGMTLLDTEDRATVELFASNNPYEKAGIRKEIRILRWRKRWWAGEFLGEGKGHD